jgi:enamine deaminase RidA (YjgF/YER057c/UK114 family)
MSDASPHRPINPESLGRPWGFSHAIVPAPGRTIYLAGETAHRADDSLPEGVVEHFDGAAANVVTALAAAGARPEHVVSMQVFVTDLSAYLENAEEIGRRYRRHFGRHYPAMALVEVKGLVGGATVEIMCTAVVPGDDSAG